MRGGQPQNQKYAGGLTPRGRPVRWVQISRLRVQPVDSSVSDPEAQGSAKTGDAPRCWVILLSPRQRPQTCRHCGDVTTLAMCDRRTDATDRPGRCHRHQSITCLPTSRELDPPAPGGFFALQKHKGQGSLCPSAPSLPNRWGRLTSPAGSLGGLSRAGKEGTAEHERARNERESSARAAGSRPTGLLEIFAKLNAENQMKT